MTQTTSRRNRLNPRRRRALKKRVQQATWVASNWATEPNSDWPADINDSHHCERCHQEFIGELHWDCYVYPSLDKETCRICSWTPVDPARKYPLIALATSPLAAPFNWFVKEISEFYWNFDYLSPTKRSIFNLFIFTLAFALARLL